MSSVVFILRVYRILYYPQSNAARGFATGGLCHASNTRYFLLRLRTQVAIESLPPFPVAQSSCSEPTGLA
jgi:hypothetical protein